MGTDSVIYIRTDGNREISTGHLVRCLSLAHSLQRRKKRVCFLVSDAESKGLLEEFLSSTEADTGNLDIITISNTGYLNLQQDYPFLLPLLHQSFNPTLILDSYYVTPEYLEKVGEAAKLVYIDDLKKFDYDVDIVLNYDLISPSEQREYRCFYSRAKHHLLGPAYTPLRPQFSEGKPSFRNRVENILITSGGSDPTGFCLRLARTLGNFSETINLHVVVGKLFSEAEKAALKELSQTSAALFLHEGLTDLAPLMKQCDLAVSAAGTTLYELCALGIPAISFTMADNQLTCARAFAQQKVIPYAGDVRGFKEELSTICQRITSFLQKMTGDPDRRKAAGEAVQRLIDGKGCERIADAICSLWNE